MAVTRVRDVDLASELSADLPAELSGPGRSGTPIDRPVMVWGHGLTSSMEREEQFGLLDWPTVSSVVRLLRYDARGHGSSSSTEDPLDYHWRNLAIDQLALADAVGIGTYIAGGASMGCATALFAGLLAPGRITGLLLAIPPTAWETRAAQRDAYELSAQLVEAGEIDLLVAGIRSVAPPDPLVDIPQWHDTVEATMRGTDPVRLARVFRGAAVAEFPTPAELATLTLPTLILAWSGDPGHPVSTAERLVELMPHAELRIASSFDELASWTDEAVTFLAGPDR